MTKATAAKAAAKKATRLDTAKAQEIAAAAAAPAQILVRKPGEIITHAIALGEGPAMRFITYKFAVLGISDRAQWRGDMIRRRAMRSDDKTVRGVIRDGIDALIPAGLENDAAQFIVDEMDSFDADVLDRRMKAGDDAGIAAAADWAMAEGLKRTRRFVGLAARIRRDYEPLRAMEADNEVAELMASQIVVEHTLKGWVDGTTETAFAGRPTEADLMAIPRAHWAQVVAHAWGVTGLTQATIKN